MTDRPFHHSDSSSAQTDRSENVAPSTVADVCHNGASSTSTDEHSNPAVITAELNPSATPIEAIPESSASYQRTITETELLITSLPTPILSDDIFEEGSANLEAVNHLTSATNPTPLQIRPIPVMAASKTGRKHKRQKSEVLTSTPVKAEEAVNFKKVSDTKTKISELAGPSKKKKKLCLDKPLSKSLKPDYYCLVCADRYTEPPTEDWIQCNQCKSWAHEDCTSYLGIGSYFCDECQD